MKLDHSSDFFLIDNLETATLKVDGQPDVPIPHVLSEPTEWKELDPTNAQVIRSGTVFVWPRQYTDAPQIGSIIVDEDGVYWTVWKGEKKQHIDTWETKCLNLNIVSAPSNVARVLTGTYTKGTANEAKATWVGLWSGEEGGTEEDDVTARFQPSEETSQIQFNSEWSKQTYRVYFESPTPIQTTGGNYRLIDSRGRRYRVVRYYEEERIDRLPVAIAVLITEGAEYVAGSSQNSASASSS